MVCLAVRVAFAVPGQKHDPAIVLARQPQQGIRQLLLVETLDIFTAPLVADHQLAIDSDVLHAHTFRRGVRVDELQRDVRLEALVVRHQRLDLLAQQIVLAGEGGQGNAVRQISQQFAGIVGDGVAAAAGPVGLVDILCAEPAKQPDNADKQHGKHPGLQAQDEAGAAGDFH